MENCVSKNVLIVGDPNCGKRSLLLVFAEKVSLMDYYSNHGACANTSNIVPINISGIDVSFTVMTISGLENEESRFEIYKNDVDTIILCFAVDNQNTFKRISSKWLPEMKTNFPGVPIVLVGNKNDLRRNNYCEKDTGVVGSKDCVNMRKKIGAHSYVECSAVENDGVYEVFETAAVAALQSEVNVGPSSIVNSIRGPRKQRKNGNCCNLL